MSRRCIYLSILVLALVPVAGGIWYTQFRKRKAPDLREELLGAYHRWHSAVISASFEEWREAISWPEYVTTRNTVVSRGQQFPGHYLDRSAQYLSKLSADQPIVANLERDTATLVFRGTGAKTEKVFIGAWFLNEDGIWKHDGTFMVSFSSFDDVETKLARKDYSFLKRAKFKSTGRAPRPRPYVECPTPDYVAEYFLVSYGYETVLRVNDFEYGPIRDTNRGSVLFGGLRKGSNAVKLSTKSLESVKKKNLSLLIRAQMSEGHYKQVLSFQPEKVPRNYETEINMPY